MVPVPIKPIGDITMFFAMGSETVYEMFKKNVAHYLEKDNVKTYCCQRRIEESIDVFNYGRIPHVLSGTKAG